MFKPVSVIFLLVVSVLLTVLLYWVDSDTPSDTLFQRAINTAIVFGVVTLLYSAGYGLRRLLNKKAID